MKRNHCFGYYFQFNKKKMCIVVKCQNIFKNIFGKGEWLENVYLFKTKVFLQSCLIIQKESL